MTTTQPIRRKISVGEYHRMAEAGILTEDDRVELLNGEIIEMSPIGPTHTAHVKGINRIISRLLEGLAVVGVQDPIVLNDLSEPIPDISILRWRADDYLEAHPRPQDVLLVIEVADSSVTLDREAKLPIYAKAGISEYWIVNIPGKKVEVYRTPINDYYRDVLICTSGDLIELKPFNLQVQVSTLLK